MDSTYANIDGLFQQNYTPIYPELFCWAFCRLVMKGVAWDETNRAFMEFGGEVNQENVDSYWEDEDAQWSNR